MTQTSLFKRYRLEMHTFGCKVNTYDSGLLQSRLEKTGAQLSHSKVPVDQHGSLPLVHLLNTCAVTAEATREAQRLARKLKARDPLSVVVVTGCAAQVDTEQFSSLPGVDLIVANSHKGQLEQILDQHFAQTLKEKVFRSNIFHKEDLETGGGLEADHTRAFLKIQDGCNSFCTYCVIPFARGKSRSIPIVDLVRRVRELVAQGAREVVLTGVHIGDYEDLHALTSERGPVVHGHNQSAARLSDLVSAILEQTEVSRLRLSSLEPIELSDELLALFKNPRLCPHFHMSVQSANSAILASMRRKYSASDVEAALKKIREQIPGAFIGMDVIAGFPGESEEHFLDTYQRLSSLPWTRMHVFPYSERPGTKAVQLADSVLPKVRAARAARLRELSRERYESEARAQMNLIKKVLVVRSRKPQLARGLTQDYWPVEWEATSANEAVVGSERTVRVRGFRVDQETRMEGLLTGEVIHES